MDTGYQPVPKRVMAVALLVIAGWIAGFYALMLLNGGHFHGADADVMYVAWTLLYGGAFWIVSSD